VRGAGNLRGRKPRGYWGDRVAVTVSWSLSAVSVAGLDSAFLLFYDRRRVTVSQAENEQMKRDEMSKKCKQKVA